MVSGKSWVNRSPIFHDIIPTPITVLIWFPGNYIDPTIAIRTVVIRFKTTFIYWAKITTGKSWNY